MGYGVTKRVRLLSLYPPVEIEQAAIEVQKREPILLILVPHRVTDDNLFCPPLLYSVKGSKVSSLFYFKGGVLKLTNFNPLVEKNRFEYRFIGGYRLRNSPLLKQIFNTGLFFVKKPIVFTKRCDFLLASVFIWGGWDDFKLNPLSSLFYPFRGNLFRGGAGEGQKRGGKQKVWFLPFYLSSMESMLQFFSTFVSK